jgi:hypothetical protein
MKRWIAASTALGWSALIAGTQAYAQAEALSAAELRRCAAQVQELRAESARLIRVSEGLEARRPDLNRRLAELRVERETLNPEDLKAGLDFHARQERQQQDAIAFNAEMDTMKRDMRRINQVKRDYDRRCAKRSFHNDDLMALTEAERHAMLMGLSGVEVPYVDE